MNSFATIITIWDHLPGAVLCLSILFLYFACLSASFSKGQWPASRQYRVFIIFLAPVLLITLFSILGSGISSHNAYLKSVASRESGILESAAFSYFMMHNNTFPQGPNREIMKALVGETLISEKSILRINSTGEVVDPWGNPYQFRFIPDKELRVISAGPDKDFGTHDDIPEHKKS